MINKDGEKYVISELLWNEYTLESKLTIKNFQATDVGMYRCGNGQVMLYDLMMIIAAALTRCVCTNAVGALEETAIEEVYLHLLSGEDALTHANFSLTLDLRWRAMKISEFRPSQTRNLRTQCSWRETTRNTAR